MNPASGIRCKGVLEDEGYQTGEAGEWRSVPRLLRTSTFDVVLLDVWLPGIDGLDTLQKIRELENPPGSHHDLGARHH